MLCRYSLADKATDDSIHPVRGSLFIVVSTMDITVKDREGGKQQETNQVFKALDVGIKIYHRVNLLYLSDI
jgi:hypothetical protein